MPDLSQASLDEIVAELRRRFELEFFILSWKWKGNWRVFVEQSGGTKEQIARWLRTLYDEIPPYG